MRKRNFLPKCISITLLTCFLLLFQPPTKTQLIQSTAWAGNPGWSDAFGGSSQGKGSHSGTKPGASGGGWNTVIDNQSSSPDAFDQPSPGRGRYTKPNIDQKEEAKRTSNSFNNKDIHAGTGEPCAGTGEPCAGTGDPDEGSRTFVLENRSSENVHLFLTHQSYPFEKIDVEFGSHNLFPPGERRNAFINVVGKVTTVAGRDGRVLDTLSLADPDVIGAFYEDGKGLVELFETDSPQTVLPAIFDFVYPPGRAEADGRIAELKLHFEGMLVTGRLIAKGDCGTGIRLPKTDIIFQGAVDSPWEQMGTVISGTWSGGDYDCNGQLMEGYPTFGGISIMLRETGNPDQEYEVFVHRVSTSKYGFVFKPKGRLVKPSTIINTPLPTWLSNPSESTVTIKEEATNASLGPPASTFSMPKSYSTCRMPPVFVSLGQSVGLTIKDLAYYRNVANEDNTKRRIKSYSFRIISSYVSPGGAIEIKNKSRYSVMIKGVSGGAGQVFAHIHLNFTDEQNRKLSANLTVSWLVLVGQKILKEYKGEKPDTALALPFIRPPSDIKKVTIIGKALRRGSQEPAAGALIFLHPDWDKKNYTVKNDGSFSCTFTNVSSGLHEIMVLRRSRLNLPGFETFKRDLWPIKQYVVDLNPKKAAKGIIDVGTLWMDRVGIIWFGGPGRDKIELRGQVLTTTPVNQPTEIKPAGSLQDSY